MVTRNDYEVVVGLKRGDLIMVSVFSASNPFRSLSEPLATSEGSH